MSGDLQRFVARAEMAPVMRNNGGLTLSREGRDMMRRLRETFGDGVVAAVEQEIAYSIAERGIRDTSELIDTCVEEARGNQAKFEQLFKIALGYSNHVGRIQRRLSSPFGF